MLLAMNTDFFSLKSRSL